MTSANTGEELLKARLYQQTCARACRSLLDLGPDAVVPLLPRPEARVAQSFWFMSGRDGSWLELQELPPLPAL